MIRTLLSVLLALAPVMQQAGGKTVLGGKVVMGGGGVSGGGASFVQEKDCTLTASPFNCTFTSNVGSGHAVVVFVSWVFGAGITISSVADGDSNAYSNTTWASGAANCHQNGAEVQLYSRANITNADVGTKTITVTFSSTPSFTTVVSMAELTTSQTANIVDKADCQQQIGTTTPASPSVTTTGADFLYAFSFDSGESSRTFTAGTTPAYTGVGSSTTGVFYQEYFVQSSGSAVTGNFTVNTSDTFSTAIVAVKP